MRYEKQRIKDKFCQLAPREYWGDDLDLRYYLVFQLKKIKNKSILEIGCGAGIILSELDISNKIFGLDRNIKDLNIARQLNPDSNFIKGDIDTLPFIKESFDVIILAAVIECSSNKNDLLKQISIILKKDGLLFVTTNNRQYSYYMNHKSLLTHDQLASLLKPYFTFQIKGYNPIPPILFFIPKALKEKINRKYQLMIPSGWLSHIPFIDCALEKIMNIPWLIKISKGFYVEAQNIQ